MDLGERFLAAEPVKSLRRHNGVDERIGKRDRLGRSVDDRDAGQQFGQLAAHGFNRLDRDNLGPRRQESLGEFARPSSQLDDASTGGDLQNANQVLDGRRRIFRPAPFIRVGRPLEADRRLFVDSMTASFHHLIASRYAPAARSACRDSADTRQDYTRRSATTRRAPVRAGYRPFFFECRAIARDFWRTRRMSGRSVFLTGSAEIGRQETAAGRWP